MILISNDFVHKRKMDNFDPCNALLSVLLMTAFVLQGHVYTQITVLSESHIASAMTVPIFPDAGCCCKAFPPAVLICRRITAGGSRFWATATTVCLA